MDALNSSGNRTELTHTELTQLLALGEQLASELDPEAVLELVAQAACRVVDAETLVVPIIDAGKRTFTYRAASGLHAELLYGQTFDIHEGNCGWVMDHRRPLLFGIGGSYDIDAAARWEPGMASSLLVPLICRGEIIGGLSAMAKRGGGAFEERDLTVLTLFANQASIAIDNARLFRHAATESERLRQVLDSTGEAIYGIDTDGRCTFANPACLRLLGYSAESDLLGQHMHTMIHHTCADGSALAEEDCYVHRAMREGVETHVDGDHHWRHDGSSMPIEGWARPMWRNDIMIGAVATFVDISERKRTEEKIHALAYFDALTQLPNRRLLLDRLSQAMISGERIGEFGALMMLDLDNFKVLNDTRGHDVGDRLLISVAERLLANLRAQDTVSRLGGDEYVLMIESLGPDEGTAAAQAEAIAEKIRTALNQPYILGPEEQAHQSTPSIGLTLFRGQETPIDALMKQADLALYQAKGAGRNTIRFFNPTMQAVIEARSEMEEALRHALQQGELRLFYQPQFDANGDILGAEALIRWLPPGGGTVSPADFIPLAEETGLIVPIGAWVIDTACAQLKAWESDPTKRERRISVNVSARQFQQAGFVAHVRNALANSRANPTRLKLELTESAVLGNVEEAISRMNEIKLMGVGFSLDDFGTGFSSLSYLKRLPLDEVKIDQSFIRDITDDPNDAAIVHAIIAMSQALGLDVIAEGVETQAQCNFLTGAGCSRFQGYLFSRPLPIEDWDRSL